MPHPTNIKKYALTKTIRFKLEPCEHALSQEVKKLESPTDSIKEVCNLQSNAQKLKELLDKYLYKPKDKAENKDEKRFFKGSLEIKTQFLKQHTSQYYQWYQTQESQANTKAYKLYRVDYVYETFNKFLSRWNTLTEELNKLIQRYNDANKPDKKPRRTEFALLISEFNKRENLSFIKDFIDLSQDKNSDEVRDDLQDIMENFITSLKICKENYLPAQTAGIAIAKASLNYYTINKRPRNYSQDILNKKDELCKKMTKDVQTIKQVSNSQDSHLIREFIMNRVFNESDEVITLDSLYKKMKKYKAKEKSRFMEAVDQGIKFEDITQNHPLFQCDKNSFNDFLDKTQSIKEFSNEVEKLNKENPDYHQKRRELKNKISNIKQARGRKFFRDRSGNYKNFCNFYKAVAMQRGKLLAEIKGIEREEIDSQLLNYWAVIVEKENNHYLMLIPKENRQKAYSKINTKHNHNDFSIKIHYFKSLTLRALKKLCFDSTNNNTFAPEIKTELRDQYPGKYDDIKGSFSLEKFPSEKEQVQLYQHALNTKYVRENLDINDFDKLQDLIKNTLIDTEESFQTELEKICYVKHILAGEKLEQYLLDNCQAQLLKITSCDLNKDSSRKGKDKQHTQIWHQFWNDKNKNQKYPIRLNPELKVYWRDAKESRLKKYGKDPSLYNPDKNNRFLHPQFTLTTTITENATSKRTDLAFKDQDKLAEAIEDFNAGFNRTYAKEPNQMYFYGIDRGNAELATLTVCRFLNQKKKNEFNQPIPEFAKFKVWRLKNLDHQEEYLCKGEIKQRQAIKNLSYFTKNPDLFEEIETSSIDLTTAKLINGKIIENGDVCSYLKLKELNAKRRLYEHINNIDRSQNSPIYFDEEKKVFRVHGIPEHENEIYFYRDDFETIQSKDEIKIKLNQCLEESKKDKERNILTIEKINHLRDALAANMVGIISHLYRHFPGIIGLENLEPDTIQEHFLKSNENISRRLEWRLYNKFQNQGLVPPKIKESILLRKTNSINQFGLIHFIPKENTSKNCPYCEQTQKAQKDTPEARAIKDEKYRQKRFICQKCRFDTYFFKDEKERVENYKPEVNLNNFKEGFKILKDINDPDKVAAYNIAKKLKSSNDIGKLTPETIKNKENSQHTNKNKSGNQQRKYKNNHPRHKKHNKRQVTSSKELKQQPFKVLPDMMLYKQKTSSTENTTPKDTS